MYDRLFSVANPGQAEDFLATINPESLVIAQGFVEPSLAGAQAEVSLQFEREGYFCADSRYSSAEQLVFNRTVGLRDTWESKPSPDCKSRLIFNAASAAFFYALSQYRN